MDGGTRRHGRHPCTQPVPAHCGRNRRALPVGGSRTQVLLERASSETANSRSTRICRCRAEAGVPIAEATSDGSTLAVDIKRWLTVAFDWTSVTWRRLTDELPKTQDFVDDVDAGARAAVQRVPGREQPASPPTEPTVRRPAHKSG